MEVKPCPFCGSQPSLLRIAGDYGYTPDAVRVVCKCGASGPKFTTQDKWDTKKQRWVPANDPAAEAAAHWNTRA